MELKLVVLAGAKEGLEIPLKKDKFLIGRAKECALRAGSEAISRRHCAILRRKDRWTVRDLGSRNGTHVNDKRISEEVVLNAGDELRVGPLKFRVASVAAETPVAASDSDTIQSTKPRKQPPVKSVADVVERSKNKRPEDSASEEDISRWLFGMPDTNGEETLKETRTIRLEETRTNNPSPQLGETVEDVSALSGDEQPAGEGEAANGTTDSKAGGWSLFKRGKPGASPKQKPGKLPPRPQDASKDSREAAADILREMTRRR